MADLREQLAGALAAHRIGYERRAYPAYVCYCGWDGAMGDDGSPGDGANDTEEGAFAHVAAALLPVVAEAVQQARAEVEAVVTEWLDESRDHYSIHGLPRMVSLGAAATRIRAALADGGPS